MAIRLLVFSILLFVIGCKQNDTLFTQLSSKKTGVDFVNKVVSNDTINAFNFVNFYNGGGVGIADFNQDGLPDICFTSNQDKPSLYLNKGNLTFDICKETGLYNQGWINGISIVDINQDGWPDIYLSTAKFSAFRNSKNLLFVNQKTKTPSFKEEAQKYGLDYDGYSTQAAFFDYDNDGDLDAYLLNTNPMANDPNTFRRSINDGSFPSTDKFYENKGKDSLGHYWYEDVSKKAGVLYEGLGLGIALGDFNKDGYTDVYCSNDFQSDDLFYINNGNGTFTNNTKQSFKHTSLFGMGTDAADINNDSHIDIMQLDMMPDKNERRKMMLMRNDFDRKNLSISSQYEYMLQYMRNTLQINNGTTEKIPQFSEQSLMHNVSSTDWSWGVLLADFNSDGKKDMYISNGYRKNVTDLDFVNYHQSGGSFQNGRLSRQELMEKVPEIKLPNFAFENTGKEGFKDVSESWGLNQLSYSNGSAYADLDLDGDLDLVVNNIDEEAFIFRNNTPLPNSLNINLKGLQGNLNGIGATVNVFTKSSIQTYTNYPTKGYLSSMDIPINIGLGAETKIDSLVIKWQSGKYQKVTSIDPKKKLILNEGDAILFQNKPLPIDPIFYATNEIAYTHEEPSFIDFQRYATLQKMITKNGPVIAMGLIDEDDLEDLVIGGAYDGSNSAVFYQNKNGSFTKGFELKTNQIEVGDVLILDINGDAKNDIVFAPGIADKSISASESFYVMSFINKGNRNLIEENIFPKKQVCSEKMIAYDFDNNGHNDLLFASTFIIGAYPRTNKSTLFSNNGKGQWSQKEADWLPTEAVKDIKLSDIDKDGDLDLLYIGHWCGLTILKNEKNKFVKTMSNIPEGWWNCIEVVDIDKDGDDDLILGNEGLNSYYKAKAKEPITLYTKDFNSDGVLDPIFSQYIYGESHVYHPLGTLTEQSVQFKKRFNNFSSYAKAGIYDVLRPKELRGATVSKAVELRSGIAINDSKGNYSFSKLPFEAQSSPISAIISEDINKDGYSDLILAGNFYHNEATQGRSDASHGHLLINDKKGNFIYLPNDKSGLKMDGDTRKAINLKNKKTIVFTRNNGAVGSVGYK